MLFFNNTFMAKLRPLQRNRKYIKVKYALLHFLGLKPTCEQQFLILIVPSYYILGSF